MSSILLVEDNPGIRENLITFLERDGHDTIAFDTVDGAVALIQGEASIDIAFVDYWLNSETAETVLDALRRLRPDVHVILITGGSKAVTVEKTKWLGALDGIDGFLQKPFSYRDLRKIIAGLV